MCWVWSICIAYIVKQQIVLYNTVSSCIPSNRIASCRNELKCYVLHQILSLCTIPLCIVFYWTHSCAVVSIVNLQQEGNRIASCLLPFCEKFLCYPQACMGLVQVHIFLPQIKNMHACVLGNSIV